MNHLKVKITGTPIDIRQEKIGSNNFYWLRFMEGGSSHPPVGLIKPTPVKAKVIITEELYKKNLLGKDFRNTHLLIEGEVFSPPKEYYWDNYLRITCNRLEELTI